MKRNKGEEAETIPCDTLCVDLIRKYHFTPKGGGKRFQTLPKVDGTKYKMTTKSARFFYLQTFIVIDPAIGWIEIRTIPSKRSDLVANQVELAWLIRYPLPNKVIVDR